MSQFITELLYLKQKLEFTSCETSMISMVFCDFAEELSHQFNNILAIIMNNVELLSSKLSKNEHFVLLKDIDKATELGSNLIDAFLTFTHGNFLNAVDFDTNLLQEIKIS
ncbi:MAG: histidine kinase dimerization/phospho-acceptor domain-containing protein [Candidatus Kariarchaeaceae archaeon]|jgi:light-regulated signal transduction histidine kinase (bacteriophytochrome)